jgi:hypothetical protein
MTPRPPPPIFSLNFLNFFPQLPNLVTALSDTDSVVVPDMGWYIFGGNALGTSQVLKEIGQPWAVGPVNHESRAVTGHCLVQVSNNLK